jgi:hypothetical protein
MRQYYLAKAAELHDKASEEKNPTLRAEFEKFGVQLLALGRAGREEHLFR